MIRRVFAQRKVLELYQKTDTIKYPICPERVLPCIPKNCRIMTYQTMAEITDSSIRDVAVMCKSNSGATHFDVDENRYLILYNSAMNAGRVRWTQCHEIGHICMDHLDVLGMSEIACADEREEPYTQFESEADFFTWNLLAPLPIMREMGIRSCAEIKTTFGLSTQAAALQYDRYVKWCQSHVKTSWENMLLREFHRKYTR